MICEAGEPSSAFSTTCTGGSDMYADKVASKTYKICSAQLSHQARQMQRTMARRVAQLYHGMQV